MNIRDCTLDDVPWVLDRARMAYAGRVEGWHEAGAALWVDACIRSDQIITVRGNGIVGFGEVMAFPWAPTVRECDLLHLFGSASDPAGMESLSVVSAIRDRAEAMGCRRMYISSIFVDLTPVGKRLGGKPFPSVYVLERRDVQ
jgi:hypothetical protein